MLHFRKISIKLRNPGVSLLLELYIMDKKGVSVLQILEIFRKLKVLGSGVSVSLILTPQDPVFKNIEKQLAFDKI